MKARALIDIFGTDIKSGEFFTADEITIKGMVSAGDADDQATEADVYGADIPEAKVLPVVLVEAAPIEEVPVEETPAEEVPAKKGKK